MNNNNICTPVTSAPQTARRRRGAPSGNQNARRHGLYSRSFTKIVPQLLEPVADRSESEKELYLALVRMAMAFKYDPENTSLLEKTLKSLVRLTCLKYDVGRHDTAGIFLGVVRAGVDFGLLAPVPECTIGPVTPRCR